MNRIIISILMIICSLSVSAQGPKNNKFDPQKFEQQMESFVVERMHLTAAEKAKFLPIYREKRKKELATIKKEGELFRKGMPKNETEWAESMKLHDAIQVQQKKIQQEYHLKMIKVIPASKVVAMIRAEEDYHRTAFTMFQGGNPGARQGAGNKGPKGQRPGGNK